MPGHDLTSGYNANYKCAILGTAFASIVHHILLVIAKSLIDPPRAEQVASNKATPAFVIDSGSDRE